MTIQFLIPGSIIKTNVNIREDNPLFYSVSPRKAFFFLKKRKEHFIEIPVSYYGKVIFPAKFTLLTALQSRID